MYQLIENFCLGTRRLEIFGRYHSLRRGWVTVTADELNLTPEEVREKDDAVPFQRENWEAQTKDLAQNGKCVVPNSAGNHISFSYTVLWIKHCAEIETLRPKSPTQRSNNNNVSVSAVPMVPSMGGMPTNPPRIPGTGGTMTSGTSGNVALGPPKTNANFPMNAQPMNMLGMNPGSGMNLASSGGMVNMGNMGGGIGTMGGMPNMGNMGSGMNWQGGATGNMMPRMRNTPNPMNTMGGQGMVNFGFNGTSGPTGMNPGFMGMQSGMDHAQGMGGMSQGLLMNQMNPAMMSGNQQLGFGFDGAQESWMGGNQAEFGGMDGGMGQQFMGPGGMWPDGFMPNAGSGNLGGMGATGFGQGARQWRGF